jgi:hypothetical protein
MNNDFKTAYAVLGTFLLSWTIFATIGWWLADGAQTFRQMFSHPAVIIFLIVFGWIPAIFLNPSNK